MTDKAPRTDYAPDIHHIIELAWRDEVSFDDIEQQTGLGEQQVIAIMRGHMKPSSFRMWRKRVTGRKTKHGHKLKKWQKKPSLDVLDEWEDAQA